MKKFFKLCLTVAALVTIFGFASCSNGNDDTTAAASSTSSTTSGTASSGFSVVTELKYTDTELAGKKFSYTSDGTTQYLLFYNGLCYQGEDTNARTSTKTTIVKDNGKLYKAAKYTRKSGTGLYTTFDDSDGGSMTFNENGTGTVSFSSGSANFTFTNASGVLTIAGNGQNVTCYYDGTNIYRLANELTFVGNYTPAAANSDNAFKGKTFMYSPYYVFGSNGNLIAAIIGENEIISIIKGSYTASGNTCSAKLGNETLTGTLYDGEALVVGDATAVNRRVFTRTSGNNGFGGKTFFSSDETKLIIFISDESVIVLNSGSKFKAKTAYTVSGSNITADDFKATFSGKTLTVTVTADGSNHIYTATLIE